MSIHITYVLCHNSPAPSFPYPATLASTDQTLTVEQILNKFQAELDRDTSAFLADAHRVAQYDALLRDSQRNVSNLTNQVQKLLVRQAELDRTLNGIGSYQSELSSTLEDIERHADEPFFLYYATPVPHLALQVPDDSLERYAGRWEETPYEGGKGYLPNATPRATYAAMITRFDRNVGMMLDELERQQKRYGLVTMCAAGGMAPAIIIERIA